MTRPVCPDCGKPMDDLALLSGSRNCTPCEVEARIREARGENRTETNR